MSNQILRTPVELITESSPAGERFMLDLEAYRRNRRTMRTAEVIQAGQLLVDCGLLDIVGILDGEAFTSASIEGRRTMLIRAIEAANKFSVLTTQPVRATKAKKEEFVPETDSKPERQPKPPEPEIKVTTETPPAAPESTASETENTPQLPSGMMKLMKGG